LPARAQRPSLRIQSICEPGASWPKWWPTRQRGDPGCCGHASSSRCVPIAGPNSVSRGRERAPKNPHHHEPSASRAKAMKLYSSWISIWRARAWRLTWPEKNSPESPRNQRIFLGRVSCSENLVCPASTAEER